MSDGRSRAISSSLGFLDNRWPLSVANAVMPFLTPLSVRWGSTNSPVADDGHGKIWEVRSRLSFSASLEIRDPIRGTLESLGILEMRNLKVARSYTDINLTSGVLSR